MSKRLILVGATSLALVAVPGFAISTAAAVAAKKFSGCAQLNQAYPHGVGRPGARDKDGIACEQH